MTADRSREVLKLALPIIGGMVSQNLLNLADAWMVGGLGPSALAATGLANFLNFVAVAGITGISPAVQAIAARRVGEGRLNETAVPLNGGLLLSLLIGVPLSAILILLAPRIFAALNHDPDVVRQGSDYLQWRLVAIAAIGMNFSFRGYWSAMKMTRLYMITLIDMHVLNVIFSYSLIHGLFGLPALGVKGAGIGTTLAIFIGTAIYFHLARKHACGHGFLERRPTGDEFRSLLKLGVPSAIQQLLFSGGFTVLFWIIGKVGTAELAVSNVLVTISLTAVLPGMGFGIAAATLCGQALGRGDAADAQRWAWDVYRVGMWLFVPLALVMLLLPGPVLTLFVRDTALVQIGRLPLQMVGINILLDALGLIMMQALLGVGASRLVMIVAVGLQWLIFLPAAYLLGPVFTMGLTAIWIAMGLYRLLQTAIFTAAWQRGGWRMIKV
ncbi:MAG: MATE family efflux transporter [Nevskiaceae bacterium]|nr:MAG: MATE family efflux transporter [Nevskiaceae bacterium]